MNGKRITLVTVMICLMFCVAIAAQKTGLTTAWSNSPSVEGFTTSGGTLISNPGKGGNPGGFLKGINSKAGVNVAFNPAPYSRKSWGVLFGTDPGTIEFDVIALDDYTIPYIIFQLTDGSNSFRYSLQTRHVLGGRWQTKPDGWVHYSIPWQATWDTAQAKAKGWKPSLEWAKWSNAINNPILTLYVIGGTSTSSTAGDRMVGIDNFRVDAGKVVEPPRPAPPQEK